MKCVNCGEVVKKADGATCRKCGFTTDGDLSVRSPADAGHANGQGVLPIANSSTEYNPGQCLAVRPATRLRPGCATIGMSVDRTGSSKEFQIGIPLIAEKSLRSLEESIAKILVDLWTHGDLEYHEEPVQLVHCGTVDQTLEAIAGIEYGGGGDALETHADQIENVLNKTAWGARSLLCRNIALFFLTDDTKRTRSGKTMSQIGAEYKDRGIKLILVCQETALLRELKDAANGFLIPISNNPDKAEIDRVVSALCATLTMAMASAGKTMTMTSFTA